MRKLYLAPLPWISQKNSSTPSSQAHINLKTSSGRLTNYQSRTLHMVYPKISRAI